MEILLIEDQIKKRDLIKKYIIEVLGSSPYRITEVSTLVEVRREIILKNYDLIIFDIYLPVNEGDEPEDISDEILCEFANSKNYKTNSIVLTQYDYEDIENINNFNENGVTVVHFDYENENWKVCLKTQLVRLNNTVKYDFLIFCALNEERSAYVKTDSILGEYRTINGLNCQDIIINNIKGLCILPPRMGLIHMAITTTKAIELFQPKIVLMSGICAGVKENSKMLDVIIAETCWEFQTGKIKNDGFKQEPYQIQIDSKLKTELDQFTQNTSNLSNIKKDLYDSELKESNIYLAPMVSGSAVIDNEDAILNILKQHRKIAGLEMEMVSFYEAAFQSLCKPLFFGAKTIVDFADGKKADNFHDHGAILSARFIVEFLKKILSTL